MGQGFTRALSVDVDPTLSANSDFLVASQKATKTYVDNSKFLNTRTETADFTLAVGDEWTLIESDTVTSVKITIPTNASQAIPIGSQIIVTTLDTGLTYFEPAGGVNLHALNDNFAISGKHGMAYLYKYDTDTWYLSGDLMLAPDPDAYLYIAAMESAGGTFTDAEKGYINDFFIGMKSDNIYTKYHVMYLFLGGIAATFKFNAVDPQDTDAAFRMIITGSPTCNANGMTLNGTTQYGNTKLTPSVTLGQNSKHYSYYLRAAGTGIGADYGAVNTADSYKGDWIDINLGGGNLWQSLSLVYNTPIATPATWTRLIQHNRSTSTSATVKRDGSTLYTDTRTTDSNVAHEIYIGARNNSPSTAVLFNDFSICFFAIADSLTPTEEGYERARVDQLQLDFGRNV